jgi:hypothetical protein
MHYLFAQAGSASPTCASLFLRPTASAGDSLGQPQQQTKSGSKIEESEKREDTAALMYLQ